MLESLDQLSPGVLVPISDGTNRPGGVKPSLLLEALKFFQKSDLDSIRLGLKKVRDAVKESEGEDWERHWPRVSHFQCKWRFFLIFS